MKATRWALQIMLILLVGLAFASAALAANNFIKIVNNCNNKIVFYYKCYNNNPWDQNTGCPMDNTMNQVEAGKSWTKGYTYNSINTCKKIYISYGRYDRSCDANDKKLKAEFPENMPKILTVEGNCQGSSFDFRMVPQGGTVID